MEKLWRKCVFAWTFNELYVNVYVNVSLALFDEH